VQPPFNGEIENTAPSCAALGKEDIQKVKSKVGAFWPAALWVLLLQTRARRFGIFFDNTTESDRRKYALSSSAHTIPHAHFGFKPLKAV
jgi:hypothetical protein